MRDKCGCSAGWTQTNSNRIILRKSSRTAQTYVSLKPKWNTGRNTEKIRCQVLQGFMRIGLVSAMKQIGLVSATNAMDRTTISSKKY